MHVPADLLGYRGDPKWRDMSDFLVHFTAQASLLSILHDGMIEAREQFGWFRTDAATTHLRMSACFSEVPIDQIERLAARRGHFGIGFRREFVKASGGGRVWYAEDPQRTLVFNVFNGIYRTDPARVDPAWLLTPFIDDVTPGYDFTWEREWRVPGGLPFTLADVQFLVIPRGSDKAIYRNPAPGIPLLSSDGMEFWQEAFAELGDSEDKFVDEFLKHFVDPINYLYWDDEDADWAWGTYENWDTRTALAELFTGELDDDAMEELAQRLDQVSPEWLSVRELDEDRDDEPAWGASIET